ncbi:hypothetical protein PLESTF_001524100 [Pleodorina starrii]|nr:hypothetical protein PLESTF_001524100 [Pleodorina starrii]
MQPFPGQAAAMQQQGGTGGAAAGSSLLHSALYGARSGSSGLNSGTALYRNFNVAPRDKGILAAAVDDAFMSPEADPVSIAAAVDPMAIDSARYNAAAAALIGDKGGVAAEATLADLSRGGRAADGSHRLNLGVVNLAAAAAAGPDMVTAAAQQQPPATNAALYGAYQQARPPLAAANGQAASLYGNNRNSSAAAAAAPAAGDAQGLRRYAAAQYHQLNVVRQIQLRQQAATAAAQQQQQAQQQAQAQAQLKAEQQAHVLAAAAEVAQQVAARNAAAAAEQQRQAQHQQARAAAEQRLLAAAPANAAAGHAGAAAAPAAAAAAQSALYNKRTSAANDAASVLYKRPALGGAAAAAEAPRAPVSALYGAYCADRHAASSAAPAVANEMMQRLGQSATVADAAVAQSAHMMAVSPAQEAACRTPGDSHCSETAFLDCHEDLSDDAGGDGADGGMGTSGDSSDSVSLAAGAVNAAAAFAKLPASGAARKALARPARPYGPVYCPTVYSDVSSPHALALANDIMGRIRLPGGIRFMPVSTDSMLFLNGVHWGFSAFALALGSSYFQRLVEITPTLNAAVRHAPPFAAYAAYMRDGGNGASPANKAQQQQQEQYLHKDGLRSILFTCAYLATKVVDRMPHTDMLRRMLSMLYNVPVSREEAHSVELKCLEGLGYRLGPYFIHNLLEDEPPCCDLY